jgi:hypothetical protein
MIDGLVKRVRMEARSLLNKINQQRRLTDQVTKVVLDALMDIYYPGLSPDEIHFAEIGSYGRGTNNDPEPDIDVMYLGIPNDLHQGFFNWIGKGTFEMAQSSEGITILSQVQECDPKLAQAIVATIKHIEYHFGCDGQAKFNFVRSWTVFPGVIFNISAPIPDYGQLGFDINLYHPTDYFGVEHSKRFVHYLERVRVEMGEEAAAKLILDIRQVKQTAKDYARNPQTRQISKAKKVWGITCEVLLTYSYPPPSRAELAAEISSMDLASFPSLLSGTDYTFPIQVIDENLSLKNVLDAGWGSGLFHERNWETLVKAIESYE